MYKFCIVFSILLITITTTLNAYPAEKITEINVNEPNKNDEIPNTEEKYITDDIQDSVTTSSLSLKSESESDGNPEETLNGSESFWGGYGGWGWRPYNGWGRGYGGHGWGGGWGHGYGGWGGYGSGWSGYGWGRPYHRYWR